MREEKKEQILIIVKMIIAVLCASLYAWGGMEERTLLRRILAPCIAGISIAVFSKNWWSLFTAPLLGISSSLGYGAEQIWLKIIKRAYCGLAFGISGSLLNILKKNYILIVFQIVLCLGVMIIFGVFNPFGSARIEESIIGLFIYSIPIISSGKK